MDIDIWIRIYIYISCLESHVFIPLDTGYLVVTIYIGHSSARFIRSGQIQSS